jgi:hypothetical protein
VTFAKPVTASLVVIANRGGAGHRSFLVTLQVSGAGTLSIQGKEGQPDVVMPLTESLPIAGVSIRCDSFSSVNCKYSVSVVGK